MSAALAEPTVAITTTKSHPSTARAEASRANGRLSHGPRSPEGKARSRRNGCKDGLTGAGIVLPPDAAAAVDRREAEFAREFRPHNAVERELVRQMALGAWRSQELAVRINRHDERVNADRFVRWEQDERIAAAELGRRLGDFPDVVVAQLEGSSAGCDWLIERWTLLGNGLSTASEGVPGCTWTDTDLVLALNLLGRSAELRHLDDQAGRLESLREEARSGSDEAAGELRSIVAQQVARLEERSEEAWEEAEQPLLRDWHAGLTMDLGPEGTRLRRYEAAADRLFRSAWTKLERLRKEHGEPLIDRSARGRDGEAIPRPDAIPAAAPASVTKPASSLLDFPESSLLGNRSPVLDLWVGGPPRPGMSPDNRSRNKTNPAPSRSRRGGREEMPRNILD
jgi:hypothetical protein